MSAIATQSPAAKQRQAVLAKMPAPLQQMAKKIEANLAGATAGVVGTQYDNGAMIREALANEGKYGSAAVEQLSQYLRLEQKDLTVLRDMVEAFPDKNFVLTNSSRTMSDGGRITMTHWLALSRLSEPKAQKAMLDRVFAESLTAKDLILEIQAGAGGASKSIRAGGRKPKVPSNPILAVTKSFQLAQAFNRFEKEMGPKLFPLLDKLDEDKVTQDVLDRLTKAREEIVRVGETAESTVKKLDSAVASVNAKLNKKYEKAEKEYDEGTMSRPAKASANGKPKAAPAKAGMKAGKKAKKKEKSRRPAVAV
jgi:hypothetical protein